MCTAEKRRKRSNTRRNTLARISSRPSAGHLAGMHLHCIRARLQSCREARQGVGFSPRAGARAASPIPVAKALFFYELSARLKPCPDTVHRLKREKSGLEL